MDRTYREKPASLDGYLELMSKVIFTSGINWKVVDAKWEGIREAFGGFHVAEVAALTPDDVERLVKDPRVIRNRKKLEAIVDNAGTLLELDRAAGGFAGHLAAQPDFPAQVADLKRNFRFMGPTSAHIFLAMVGEPVPESADCAHFAHRG